LLSASALFALLAGCSGSGGEPIAPVAAHGNTAQQSSVRNDATSSVVTNPGFETGSNSPWTSCGSVSGPKPSTAQAHSGTYSELIGTTAKPEVNGTKAVCQTVTVPAGATLTFWVYEGTNDTIKYVDQEADVLSTSGTQLAQLYAEAASTGGWVQKSFSLSAYAGQTVQLYFGIAGNGYASGYVYEYLDDVSLTGSGTPTATPTASTAPTATPTSAPTASPTSTPSSAPSATPKPTATPTATAKPTATPTAAPTATPSSLPFPCNNAQFNSDQAAFAAGTITADQPEDVCGVVTQVLAEKKTTSGNHGYFYVELPSGYQIEIVSNLDAMAQASTDQPPATWPWVAVNQYVYVQGRYYYDSSSSQGIDWTEDDTSSSWSHLGYVAVCTDSGTNCQKYW
jgi:cell division septation protein DedD